MLKDIYKNHWKPSKICLRQKKKEENVEVFASKHVEYSTYPENMNDIQDWERHFKMKTKVTAKMKCVNDHISYQSLSKI